MYDILLLGDYFFDIIYSGLTEFPELGREVMSSSLTTTGGGMFITAAALCRLGARVGWPATFGSDPYSAFVHDLSLQEGIDLRLARTLPCPFQRVTTSMPLHNERAFVTYVDPAPEDRYAFWLGAVSTAEYRHLHVDGARPLAVIGPILEAARARGKTISMDCQDSPLLKSGCDWKALLQQVDTFMPNAREARIIAGVEDTAEAARIISRWVDRVVVKDGPNGAWIGHGDTLVHVQPIFAGEVVDTTGAGDCFNAGFLYACIVEEASDLTCGIYGNICGGLSVTGVGGATSSPTHAQLRAWFDKLQTPQHG
jgi:sugar/nucleoside kinase (ribokinase family)